MVNWKAPENVNFESNYQQQKMHSPSSETSGEEQWKERSGFLFSNFFKWNSSVATDILTFLIVFELKLTTQVVQNLIVMTWTNSYFLVIHSFIYVTWGRKNICRKLQLYFLINTFILYLYLYFLYYIYSRYFHIFLFIFFLFIQVLFLYSK